MNVFNKIVVVLMLILIICLSIVGIFNSFVKVFKWSEIAAKILDPDAMLNPYISTLALLLVIVFCIFLFILEFYRKKAKVAIVAAVKDGTAVITLESAANQIKESISKISGTGDIFVKVIPKSNGVDLNIRAKICSDCNVPEKMQEIIKGASNFTAQRLGIKVYKTNLTIFHLSNIQYEPSGIDISKNEIQKPLSAIIPEKVSDEKTELPDGSNVDDSSVNFVSDNVNENDSLK